MTNKILNKDYIINKNYINKSCMALFLVSYINASGPTHDLVCNMSTSSPISLNSTPISLNSTPISLNSTPISLNSIITVSSPTSSKVKFNNMVKVNIIEQVEIIREIKEDVQNTSCFTFVKSLFKKCFTKKSNKIHPTLSR